MKIKILNLALVCVFLFGCVHTQAIKLGTETREHPPVPPDEVKIFRKANQVPGEYEEIALLTSTGDSMWTTEKGMYISMKKKAGKVGANAIILDAMSEPSAGAKVASAFLGVGGAERRGKAVAIYCPALEEKK